MEEILCSKCYELINVEPVTGDYSEKKQGETLGVITCKGCGTKNAISWEATVDYHARIATEEDIKMHMETYGEEL